MPRTCVCHALTVLLPRAPAFAPPPVPTRLLSQPLSLAPIPSPVPAALPPSIYVLVSVCYPVPVSVPVLPLLCPSCYCSSPLAIPHTVHCSQRQLTLHFSDVFRFCGCICCFCSCCSCCCTHIHTHTCYHTYAHTHSHANRKTNAPLFRAGHQNKKTTKQRESNKSSVVSRGRGKLSLRGEGGRGKECEWRQQRERALVSF